MVDRFNKLYLKQFQLQQQQNKINNENSFIRKKNTRINQSLKAKVNVLQSIIFVEKLGK